MWLCVCVLGTSYFCEQSSCAQVVHDTDAIAQNGCEEQDVIFKYTTVGTRSGKPYYNTSTNTSTRTHVNTNTSASSSAPDSPIDVDFWSEDEMLPVKVQMKDASTQTDYNLLATTVIITH